jgi:hypothetical protein
LGFILILFVLKLILGVLGDGRQGMARPATHRADLP